MRERRRKTEKGKEIEEGGIILRCLKNKVTVVTHMHQVADKSSRRVSIIRLQHPA